MKNKEAMKTKKKEIYEINREIEEIFTNATDNAILMNKLTRALNKHLWIRAWCNVFKWISLFGCIFVAIYFIPLLNWNVSAIGRLFMIRLLPFWDWQYLYDEQCLLQVSQIDSGVRLKADLFPEGLPDNDCSLCENLDYLPRTTIRPASFIRDEYLLRSIPVIIEDSHNITEDYFLEKLVQIKDKFNANPCNVKTNLRPPTTVSISHLLSLTTVTMDGFFLHFRNCQFDAVKASRALWRKPDFVLLHLNPFYSSWILMSQNYDFKKPKPLILDGFIIVTQILGRLIVNIQPKISCSEDCLDFEVTLHPGDSFLFLTELWEISYSAGGKGRTISFISEYDWNQ